MNRAKLASLIIVLALAISGSTANAAANEPVSQGLSISPAINYLGVKPGSAINSAIELFNGTDNFIQVNLAIKQFSVRNYSYEYLFAPPAHNWIKLSQSQLQLAPDQRLNVDYAISVPPGSAPGGNYFTLIASTKFVTGNIVSIGQAASLIYLTVAGNLQYSSKIISSSTEHFSFGSNINYNFTILPKGNVYSYVYTYAHLGKITTSQIAHIVYPNAIRKISGTIGHPTIPGLYKITYGYRSSSNMVALKSSWVIYFPPWLLALIIVVVLIMMQLKFKPTRLRRRP